MRKKLTVLVLLGLALVLLAGPALAAGTSRTTYLAKQGTKQRQQHVVSLTGTIVALDSDNRVIAVDVQMTNKPYVYLRVKTNLEIHTDSKTVYYYWPTKTSKRTYGSFGILTSGDKVSINARETANGTFVARRVEVAKPRYP